VLHIVGGTWGEVAGAALQAIGLAVVGLRLLSAADVRAVRIPADSYVAGEQEESPLEGQESTRQGDALPRQQS
jgi:hypothetical protein